jgi:tripartite-type tricarboxylate transporter receptor subunit TctC
MKLTRRRFLHLAAGAAALPAVSGFAWAQSYPMRPVRIVVPAAAGGIPDIAARLIGQWLSERLGQPFIVENRPGGGGNIGTEVIVKASPDGHMLLLVVPNNAFNATLYEKLNYNFIRDIAPVSPILDTPEVMMVHPSVPARTVLELIAYAKSNPGKLNMASPGNGTGPHLSGELFKMMTGIDMVHVPYRGGVPAMTDLIGGQVQVLFIAPAVAIEHIRAGKVHALAVTTASRSDVLPDVPPVAEFVPGYASGGWFGIGAPKETPPEIVEQLNKEINAALADPKIRARIANMGSNGFAGSPLDFGRHIAAETDKWAKVIRAAGIRPES